MDTTTNLARVKAGEPYTWGRVAEIHEIGDYAIIEAHGPLMDGACAAKPRREDPTPTFHPYVRGEDWSHAYVTLDEAICACIVFNLGGWSAAANSTAAECMIRCATPRSA